MPHRYACTYASVKYAKKGCAAFAGDKLDEAVLKRVLSALRGPPVEMLKEALAEARKADEIRARNLEAERGRLDRREQLLRDQLEYCNPKYHLFYNDLQEKINGILEERQRFEQRLLAEGSLPKIEATGKEIEELCELASDVPKIWHHPLVTDQERKQIIRCLIDKVVVNATTETIEATIHWASGTETSIKLYRRAGHHNLIRELHAEGCTTKEIVERLARGETSTGQALKLSPDTFWKIYKRLGLKPNRRSSWVAALQKEAAERCYKGETCRQIAEDFNCLGLRSPAGRPWSGRLVSNLIAAVKRKPDHLDALHREVFLDAKRRGLNFAQMAREFNEKGIPRYNGRPWHKEATIRKWRALCRMKAERKDERLPETEHRKSLELNAGSQGPVLTGKGERSK